MRVEAISAGLQTAKVMPLKNVYAGKVSDCGVLKTDTFEKQGQKDVAFNGGGGAGLGAALGAFAATIICPAAGPILLAYYGGAILGGVIGHEIEEHMD